jgi:hypothetical protein
MGWDDNPVFRTKTSVKLLRALRNTNFIATRKEIFNFTQRKKGDFSRLMSKMMGWKIMLLKIWANVMKNIFYHWIFKVLLSRFIFCFLKAGWRLVCRTTTMIFKIDWFVEHFILITKPLMRGLNIKLDLQSLFGLLCTAKTPQPPPPPHAPAYGIIYMYKGGAICHPRKTTSLCNPLHLCYHDKEWSYLFIRLNIYPNKIDPATSYTWSRVMHLCKRERCFKAKKC